MKNIEDFVPNDVWSNPRALLKVLTHIFEHGEDDDGQIVLYTNHREITKYLCREDSQGKMGVYGTITDYEEFPEDPYISGGEPRSAN